MNNIIKGVNQFFAELPEKLRRHRLIIWVVFIADTIFFAFGVGRISIDMSMDSYFNESDPVKQAYDRFRYQFGSDESIYIVYRAKDGDIFSEKSLKTLQMLHDELEKQGNKLKKDAELALDHVTDITSLINVSYMEVRGDTLKARDFIADNPPATQADRERLRKEALAHPDYPYTYLSLNSEYGGILVETDLGTISVENEANKEESYLFDEDAFGVNPDQVESLSTPQFKSTELHEYTALADAVNSIINRPLFTQQFEFHPVGNPELMRFFDKVIASDLENLFVGSLFLIIIVLLILFRSFAAVIWPVSIIIATAIWILGIAGWLNIPMSSMIGIIIFLILAVGIADTVHILSGYLYFRNHGQEHEQAMNSVFRTTGLACFFTSFTTMIGLLALLFVPTCSHPGIWRYFRPRSLFSLHLHYSHASSYDGYVEPLQGNEANWR